MEKKGKKTKKVVSAIGLATAAACCFGVASATGIANNIGYSEKIVEVYADDYFSEQWNEAIGELKRINSDITSKDNYVDYLFAYINATEAYAMISASVSPEDYLVYEQAGLIIRADAECYTYFAHSLSNLYINENICWSNKIEYEFNVTYFDSLESMKQEAIVGAIPGGKFEEMRNYADGEFTRLQTAMEAVIGAIDNIYYNADGNIVVNSKDSLDAVAQAIYEIYNKEYSDILPKEVEAIGTYVINIGDYDQALIDYNKITDECANLDNKINSIYIAFTSTDGEYYNKYYTQRSLIEGLCTEYDALYRADDDDATTLIKEVTKLNELESSLAEIDVAKSEVIELISNIPSEFNYIDDYIDTTILAKEAFDKLPEDLKDIADTEITDYSKLVKALEDIEKCENQVADLIDRANNLKDLYDNGSETFASEVNAVAKERSKLLYVKQQADFDEKCADILFEMQTMVVNLNAKIGPFISAVQAIGDVKLSNNDIGSQIGKAYEEYNKLGTDLERNAVLGHKATLDEKKAALDELMAEANEWKAKVEAIVIGDKITTNNIGDIDNVEAELEQIKADNVDMWTVITTSGTTYGYSSYETLISAREGLFAKINQLSIDMAALSTDLSVIVSDPAVFNQAVLTAQETFGSFDDSVKNTYFTADNAQNKQSYENYLAALNIYDEVAKFAGDIASLYDISTVDMTKYENIIEYNEIYNNLSDENKEILNTQKINDDKTFKQVLDAATEKVTILKNSRDEWTNKVYALVGEIVKSNWEVDLFSVNLEIIEELKIERATLDNTDNSLDEVDADFALIESIGNSRVTELNALIAELDAKHELEKTDVATLESIYDIFNNKLDQTQKDLVDYDVFEVLYNKYVFAQNFDEAVIELYKDVVTNGNYTTEVPITIGILRSIYINFGSEMKALIQEYNKIDEIEAQYNARVESEGGILNLTNVYNELLSKLEADGSNLSTEISAMSSKIAEIEKAYVEADALLKEALEEAYKAGDAELQGKIDELAQALENAKALLQKADADIIAEIGKVSVELAEVQAGLEKLVSDTKDELLGQIDLLSQELTKAKEELAKADTDNKAELQGKIDELTQALENAKALLQKADEDIIAEIGKVREELAEVKGNLEQLVSDTKTELLGEIDSLRKSLTTTTIILSIVSGLAVVGVVVLFILKKKN